MKLEYPDFYLYRYVEVGVDPITKKKIFKKVYDAGTDCNIYDSINVEAGEIYFLEFRSVEPVRGFYNTIYINSVSKMRGEREIVKCKMIPRGMKLTTDSCR